MIYKEIESDVELVELLSKTDCIKKVAFQSLDFEPYKERLEAVRFIDCLFLGCNLPDVFELRIRTNNLIFPRFDIPYNPYRNSLYSRESLYGEYNYEASYNYNDSFDKQVYNHYLVHGKEATDIKETLARRLHDHAITDALYDFLKNYDEKKIVAIMGGHDLARNDPNFLTVARISKKLTEMGYLMISGGGPGAMEATHIGAWFAGKDEQHLLSAISILADAPTYTHDRWLVKALEVMALYPESKYESLGIPTWFYGHEPPTPFATKIAKLFENSIREEGLLAIAKGGVVFSPGNAGTVQEIFQEAAQNHYLSFGYASPMVFLNKSYWTDVIPVYPLLSFLLEKGKYNNLILSLCDTGEEVINEIRKFV
ncbi:MAG: hypothetical protein PHU68_10835 [Paludibacter sp.]|nr:hypothetical protein [Paludibacter sp.]